MLCFYTKGSHIYQYGSGIVWPKSLGNLDLQFMYGFQIYWSIADIRHNLIDLLYYCISTLNVQIIHWGFCPATIWNLFAEIWTNYQTQIELSMNSIIIGHLTVVLMLWWYLILHLVVKHCKQKINSEIYEPCPMSSVEIPFIHLSPFCLITTGRGIDTAPGAWFITKNHLARPGCLRSSRTFTAESWPKTPFIYHLSHVFSGYFFHSIISFSFNILFCSTGLLSL